MVGRDGGFAVIEVSGLRVRIEAASEASGKVTVGIRPQHLTLAANGVAGAGCNVLPGRIKGRTFSGNLVHIEVELDGGQSVTVETRPEDVIGDAGTEVNVHGRPSGARSLPQ